MNEGIHRYDSIIELPHYEPRYHMRMDRSKRAAQFAPYDALVGYREACAEERRLTEDWASIDEYEASYIDMKLQQIYSDIASYPKVRLIYFEPDQRKDGGSYLKKEGRLKKIDEYERMLIFEDKDRIPIDWIREVEIV